MKDSKPNWQITNVSWEIRKVILQQLARGQTITEILHDFELHADLYLNAPIDRNTISKVKKELALMPDELVKTLIMEVPEAKAYILESRPDLKASEISSNSTTLDQSLNTDPIIIKAKKEHLNDIRQLIKRWRDEIETLKIEDLSVDYRGNIIFLSTKHEYQFDPLFKCLREHLPSPKLWEYYSIWKNSILGYFNTLKILSKEITNDKEIEVQLIEHPYWEPRVIIEPILICIGEKAAGNEPEILNNLNPETQEPESYLLVISEPGSEKVIDRKPRTEGGIEIIRTEQIKVKGVQYVDLTICNKYLHSESVISLIELFRKLKEQEQVIHELLDEALISRNYITLTCRLCPGQS
jgi:hypothetical protein